ncbi:MAG TPA: YbaN family protein [Fimbriimonadales bacterium]|nr:YbaN family protein [Fimbriimonadales bacterium]
MRSLFLVAGFFFAGLGFVGMFVPLMPTTIFLVLSLFCFGRSSPYWENRLLANPLLGDALKNWQEHKSISRKHKILAIFTLWISLGISMICLSELWLRMLLFVLGMFLTLYLLTLRTYRETMNVPKESLGTRK